MIRDRKEKDEKDVSCRRKHGERDGTRGDGGEGKSSRVMAEQRLSGFPLEIPVVSDPAHVTDFRQVPFHVRTFRLPPLPEKELY